MRKKLLLIVASALCVHNAHASELERKTVTADQETKKKVVAELEQEIGADTVIQKTARECIKELVSPYISAAGVQTLIAAYAVVPYTMVERNKNENVKEHSRLHPDTFVTNDGRLLASMEGHLYDVHAARYLRTLNGSCTHTIFRRNRDKKDILFQRGASANDSYCYDLQTLLATKKGMRVSKEGMVGNKFCFGLSDESPAYAYATATTVHALVRAQDRDTGEHYMGLADLESIELRKWAQPDVQDFVLCDDGTHRYAACYNVKDNEKQATITVCDLNNPKDDGTAVLCQVQCVKTKKKYHDHFAHDKSMASFVDNTGKLLLAVANNNRIELYDVQSQKQTCVLDAAGDVIMHCAAKTIGQQSFVVACMAHNAQRDSTRLVVWDLATKERIVEQDFTGKIVDLALAQDRTLVAHRQDKQAEHERFVEHIVFGKVIESAPRADGKIDLTLEMEPIKGIDDAFFSQMIHRQTPFENPVFMPDGRVRGVIKQDKGPIKSWWSHLRLTEKGAQDLVEAEPATQQTKQ